MVAYLLHSSLTNYEKLDNIIFHRSSGAIEGEGWTDADAAKSLSKKFDDAKNMLLWFTLVFILVSLVALFIIYRTNTTAGIIFGVVQLTFVLVLIASYFAFSDIPKSNKPAPATPNAANVVGTVDTTTTIGDARDELFTTNLMLARAVKWIGVIGGLHGVAAIALGWWSFTNGRKQTAPIKGGARTLDDANAAFMKMLH